MVELAQVIAAMKADAKAEAAMPLSKLLTVFVGVCNGLAYAHSRGVIHRDLKPANVMIGEFGEVYVMDWGQALVLRREGDKQDPFAWADTGTAVLTRRSPDEQTLDGSVLGTPAFMPPEQARGDIAAIDQRSDIYALGAILYQMLTLRPPVEMDGGQYEVLRRAAAGEILPPQQRCPDRAAAGKISAELSAIAMKALAKNPADRYPDVESLRRDIERHQQGFSVSARQDSYRELLWKLVRRNRAASAAAAVVALMLVVTMALIGWSWVQTNRAWQETSTAYAAYREEQKQKDERTKQAVPAFGQSARQAANNRQLPQAMAQVDLALAYDPKNSAARCLRGELLAAQKDLEGARKELRTYLSYGVADPDAQAMLKLCGERKADDPYYALYTADLLYRRRMPGLAAVVLTDLHLAIENRKPLLERYRKQINAALKPGLGNWLQLNAVGQFVLDLTHEKSVPHLAGLEGIPLYKLDLYRIPVGDLSPFEKIPELRELSLGWCQVETLEPLTKLQLVSLDLNHSTVTDFEPLRKMKTLVSLHLVQTRVHDLRPLQELPLKHLNITNCWRIDDEKLKVIEHLRLESIGVAGTRVRDLSPLRGMKLKSIYLEKHQIEPNLKVLEEMQTLEFVNVRDVGKLPAADFWKRVAADEWKR